MSGCTEALYPWTGTAPWLWIPVGWWILGSFIHICSYSLQIWLQKRPNCCWISLESVCVAVTLPSASHSGLRGDQCKPPAPTMTLPLIPSFPPTGLIKLCWCGTSTSTTWTWSGKVPMCVTMWCGLMPWFREPVGAGAQQDLPRAISHRAPSSHRFLINFFDHCWPRPYMKEWKASGERLCVTLLIPCSALTEKARQVSLLLCPLTAAAFSKIKSNSTVLERVQPVDTQWPREGWAVWAALLCRAWCSCSVPGSRFTGWICSCLLPSLEALGWVHTLVQHWRSVKGPVGAVCPAPVTQDGARLLLTLQTFRLLGG